MLDVDYSDDADGVSDVANNLWSQGKPHDEETGLIYNNARMRHPRLGRWIQREPLGYVDGLSLYQYVRSNPAVFLDPDGKKVVGWEDPNPGDPVFVIPPIQGGEIPDFPIEIIPPDDLPPPKKFSTVAHAFYFCVDDQGRYVSAGRCHCLLKGIGYVDVSWETLILKRTIQEAAKSCCQKSGDYACNPKSSHLMDNVEQTFMMSRCVREKVQAAFRRLGSVTCGCW